MAFSPIPEGTPQWDVPLNAALVTQDTQLTSTSATVSSLQTQLNSLDSQVAALSAIATGGSYYRLIAAADSSALVKSKADYVCDGSADQVEIQTAINAAQLEGGGVIQLSEGSFALSTPIIINGTTNEDNPLTVTLKGCGEFATYLRPATDVNAITISNWAQLHLADFGIVIQGAGNGIVSQSVTTTDTRSFWASSFRNLRINGEYNPLNTGWAMDLAMPWRSVFDNIEIEGTRNGMRLLNEGTIQNAGDCTFTRMFIEIVGDGGTAIHVSSPSNNMNQNNFNMVEAGANGAGCTGILIDGASGGASQRFWGLNLEQFQFLINVVNGESNVFECNYVTCDDDNVTGNVAFQCGTNSYGNTFSAKWINVPSGQTLLVIDDNNNTSNVPNIFENIRIENNGGTVNYEKTNSTVFRSITTFNDGGTIQAGLLQYPLSTTNDATFTPADHGLVTWTHDPATLRSASNATTSGTVYLCKVKVVERSAVVSNVIVGIEAAGATLTAGQSLVGLYNSSGTRLAQSADQSANWTSTGLKTIALTAAQTLAVGSYYVAILSVGTTPPQFAMGAGGSTSVNAGLTTATARFLTGPTAQTSLPASITLGSQTPTSGARWAALS